MPKGKYAVLLTFDGDYDDMDDITKMDGVDNVVVNSDTTLRFSGSNCTKKIEMRLQLPNGEAAGLPYSRSTGMDYTNANIESGSINTLQMYISPKGKLLSLASVFYNLPYNSATIGDDRTHGGDLFVNPNLPDCFGHYVMYVLRPMDKTTKKVDPTQPTVIGSRFLRPAVHSGTYTHAGSDYKPVKLPKFNKTLYQSSESNAKLQYTYELSNVGSNTGLTFANGLNNTNSPVLMINTDFDSPMKHMLNLAELETKEVKFFSVSVGSGVTSPRFYVGPDGESYFPISETVGQVLSLIANNETEDCGYSAVNHPVFAYNTAEQQVEFGNTSPFMTYTTMTNQVSGKDFDTPYGFFLDPLWVGLCGEQREADHYKMTFTATVDKDTVYKNFDSFQFGVMSWGSDENNKGKRMVIHCDNRNVKVDTIVGHSHSEIGFSVLTPDVCPPSLQMVQLRNQSNKITNRFEHLADVTINMSGGDFNFVIGTQHFVFAPATWKVEVAPYNTENWSELAATEMPEYFRLPAHGSFYRATMAGKDLKSDNGWFKLRVTITDATGNYTKQTFGPAFYAADAVNAVGTVDADNFSLMINGDLISTNNGSEATFNIYGTDGKLHLSTTGTNVDASALPAGIYVVKAVSAAGVATVKFIK